MAPAQEKNGLPAGFLDGPAPNLTKSVIDFKKEGLFEYEERWAVVLDGVLSEEECDHLIAAAEATTGGVWERAMVNVGGGMQAMYEDVRKCGRIIWDDREMVARIWARIEASVPEIHRLENWPTVTGPGPSKRKETWKATRLNERMRFLKYVGGEYFKAHGDGAYETPDGKERSYFTLHLYLNDAEGQLKGGATTFHSMFDQRRRIDVVPKSGRVLLFQHRDLLHSGDDVVNGVKYTMRTDIMYRIAKEDE
ncbi:oxidoreductase domain-containing protein [Lentithecium fluviatile CBS 122367]|uniref:Oxidoreductase domain-containing protein n=1 Tax=Lentithecium fluviatile CBS 122367 TaxID=1168545 RepID=A0A6G1IS62_9PLEO|nr:oxidoreductase domain-containing protein [Lentithecium fluviatile CBS 122367]